MAVPCWGINSKNIAKGHCYVIAPNGSPMYPLWYGLGGCDSIELV